LERGGETPPLIFTEVNNLLKNKMKKLKKGIPLKAFENMTIGEIRKLDSQYRKLLKGG